MSFSGVLIDGYFGIVAYGIMFLSSDWFVLQSVGVFGSWLKLPDNMRLRIDEASHCEYSICKLSEQKN